MKKPALLLAAAVSTLALAGGVGIGVASADPTGNPGPGSLVTPSAAPSSAAGKADRSGNKQRRDLTARALHGEATLGGKQHRVVQFQRGTVATVSATSVKVRSADGFVGTYTIGAGTKVRKTKDEAKIDDVKAGDRVRVVAVKDGSALTATRLIDRER